MFRFSFRTFAGSETGPIRRRPLENDLFIPIPKPDSELKVVSVVPTENQFYAKLCQKVILAQTNEGTDLR